MRRTALLAGLVTAIVGGAATFAAADTAPTATDPPPDPYLGSWVLMIDGDYAGPVASVDDCNLRARVVSGRPAGDGFALKHVVHAASAPCTIEVGLGMSRAFNGWLSRSLANDESPRTMQLVRTDSNPYALELGQARLASVALPKIDRASTNPAFLKIGLAAETLQRTSAPSVNAGPARGYAPALVAVDIGGVRTNVATLGPWKTEVTNAPVGELREDSQRIVDVGNLPLRVPEKDAALKLAPWLQSFLVEGNTTTADERSVMVSLTDGKTENLELRFDYAGLAEGDLTARADGSRSYTLYAERVAAAAL